MPPKMGGLAESLAAIKDWPFKLGRVSSSAPFCILRGSPLT